MNKRLDEPPSELKGLSICVLDSFEDNHQIQVGRRRPLATDERTRDKGHLRIAVSLAMYGLRKCNWLFTYHGITKRYSVVPLNRPVGRLYRRRSFALAPHGTSLLDGRAAR